MSKIEKAKEECGYKTSEYMFGLVSPTEHQCKSIDSIVEKVKNIEKFSVVGRYDQENTELLRDKLFDIEHEVYDLSSEIEKVRSALEDVRAWGQDWKDLAKKLIENYDIPIEDI